MRRKKFQENPLTFDWSVVLSKSDLRDPLNPLFWFIRKLCVSTKTWFVPIDHHAIFNMFKLSFCGSDKKCLKKIFKKNLWLDPNVCEYLSWLVVYKNGLKKSSSFKKISHFLWKNGPKMPETCDEICLYPQNPLFCIKNKHIYIKCSPYMGLHSCQLPGLLKKF